MNSAYEMPDGRFHVIYADGAEAIVDKLPANVVVAPQVIRDWRPTAEDWEQFEKYRREILGVTEG